MGRQPVALEGCVLATLLTMRDSRSCSRASSSTGSISPSFTTSDSTKIPDYYPRKPYRMASSFELGYEQPQTYRQRAKNLAASSHSNLFGPLPPGGVARPLSKKVLPPV